MSDFENAKQVVERQYREAEAQAIEDITAMLREDAHDDPKAMEFAAGMYVKRWLDANGDAAIGRTDDEIETLEEENERYAARAALCDKIVKIMKGE